MQDKLYYCHGLFHMWSNFPYPLKVPLKLIWLHRDTMRYFHGHCSIYGMKRDTCLCRQVTFPSPPEMTGERAHKPLQNKNVFHVIRPAETSTIKIFPVQFTLKFCVYMVHIPKLMQNWPHRKSGPANILKWWACMLFVYEKYEIHN